MVLAIGAKQITHPKVPVETLLVMLIFQVFYDLAFLNRYQIANRRIPIPSMQAV